MGWVGLSELEQDLGGHLRQHRHSQVGRQKEGGTKPLRSQSCNRPLVSGRLAHLLPLRAAPSFPKKPHAVSSSSHRTVRVLETI